MLSNTCWLFWQNIIRKKLFHYSYNNRKKGYCQSLLLNCNIPPLLDMFVSTVWQPHLSVFAKICICLITKNIRRYWYQIFFPFPFCPPSSNYVNQKNVQQYNYLGNYVSKQYHNNPHWQFIFLYFFYCGSLTMYSLYRTSPVLFLSRLSDHIKVLCGQIRSAENMISVSLEKALNKPCTSLSVTSRVTCDLWPISCFYVLKTKV